MVLQVNDLVLLEVNAEISKLTIFRISGHFFHENFTDFDRVFGVSDENGTYYDRESYVLDPKLTLTCKYALHRKVPILYRIGKKYSASSASRVKKIPSALRVNLHKLILSTNKGHSNGLEVLSELSLIAYWVIFHIFLSSVDFFQNYLFSSPEPKAHR